LDRRAGAITARVSRNRDVSCARAARTSSISRPRPQATWGMEHPSRKCCRSPSRSRAGQLIVCWYAFSISAMAKAKHVISPIRKHQTASLTWTSAEIVAAGCRTRGARVAERRAGRQSPAFLTTRGSVTPFLNPFVWQRSRKRLEAAYWQGFSRTPIQLSPAAPRFPGSDRHCGKSAIS
jgi:hypothetical protein